MPKVPHFNQLFSKSNYYKPFIFIVYTFENDEATGLWRMSWTTNSCLKSTTLYVLTPVLGIKWGGNTFPRKTQPKPGPNPTSVWIYKNHFWKVKPQINKREVIRSTLPDPLFACQLRIDLVSWEFHPSIPWYQLESFLPICNLELYSSRPGPSCLHVRNCTGLPSYTRSEGLTPNGQMGVCCLKWKLLLCTEVLFENG